MVERSNKFINQEIQTFLSQIYKPINQETVLDNRKNLKVLQSPCQSPYRPFLVYAGEFVSSHKLEDSVLLYLSGNISLDEASSVSSIIIRYLQKFVPTSKLVIFIPQPRNTFKNLDDFSTFMSQESGFFYNHKSWEEYYIHSCDIISLYIPFEYFNFNLYTSGSDMEIDDDIISLSINKFPNNYNLKCICNKMLKINQMFSESEILIKKYAQEYISENRFDLVCGSQRSCSLTSLIESAEYNDLIWYTSTDDNTSIVVNYHFLRELCQKIQMHLQRLIFPDINPI